MSPVGLSIPEEGILKKLTLTLETIRNLSDQESSNIVGGLGRGKSVDLTQCYSACPDLCIIVQPTQETCVTVVSACAGC